MKLCPVQSVLTGKIVPFTRPGSFSAINRQPRSGPLSVGLEGIEGDEHGDPRVHGGPDKAIHHYPYEHYQHWRNVLGEQPLLNAPGAFGENLSSVGLTEDAVYLGDVIAFGTTLLQVTQTRQPCWKINDRFGTRAAAQEMQSSGRVGWYYRVLQPGVIETGADMHLVDRPNPDWSLRRVLRLLYEDTMNLEALKQLQLLELPPSWQKLVRNRIETQAVESWHSRLDGPI